MSTNTKQPYSRYSDFTLQGMTKTDLIEYIRLLEKNLYTAEKFNEQQAINCEKLLKDADNDKFLLEEKVADILSDLHALMWKSGDGCEICAHKIVDERKPYRCLHCELGNDSDCDPLWHGLALHHKITPTGDYIDSSKEKE